MQFISRLAAAFAAVVLAMPATAAVTPYLDAAAFQAALTGGSYTETFTGVTDTPPTSYGNGTFQFDAGAAGSLFGTNDRLSTNDTDDALILTFTSGNVRGVGGNFFLTDFDGDHNSAYDLLIVFSSGEIFQWTSLNESDFVGFVSDNVLDWVAFVPYNWTSPRDVTALYATIDNVIVGNVPEPASLALVALAVAGLAARRRRSA